MSTTLAGAALLIDSSLFGQVIGSGAGAWDYLRLAWLASSVATIGGALGATVETDEAVREAAYAFRPERERSHSHAVVGERQDNPTQLQPRIEAELEERTDALP